MVDYYTVVQRAVAALKPDTEAARQALYERARAALAKHLCLKNPSLPNDGIRAELSALEEAIKKVESEAWSKRYEIKEKREFVESDRDRARPKRNTVFRLGATALLAAAGGAYFILWMRFSGSASIAAALVLLSVFALPVAFVFILVIYPILWPLLWVLRRLNKKLLQRAVGGEILANAVAATILSAVLCAIGAWQAPGWFSWWAAGWCWLGCIVPLTLDPGIVDDARSWLRRAPGSKAVPAKSSNTPVDDGVSPTAIDRQARGPSTSEEAPRSVAA